MLKHIILMNFPDPADADEAARRLAALEDVIDVVRDIHVGRNVVESDRAYDLGFVATLDSLDDLPTYQQHPAHVEAAAFVRERRSGSVSCDFVVD